MPPSRLLLSLLIALAGVLAGANARALEPPVTSIALQGFATPFVLDADALRAMPRVQVKANDHGTAATWSGVRLADVLQRAGAPLGDALRGAAVANVVIVSASDGYVAALALAEFDPAFGDADALLADTRDGKPLDATEGPFRLVLAKERRGARAVRQITQIELRSLRPAP
jgi:hypothetical protein